MLSFDFTFVWTAVNLLVLFLFLRKFLFGRVTAFMDERSARIQADREQAAADKAEAGRSREEYAAKLKEANAERVRILDEARQKADAHYAEAVQQAKSEAAQVMETAARQAEQEREKAMSHMRDEVASLALAAASKVMESNMDTGRNRKLVDEFLDELDEGGGAA